MTTDTLMDLPIDWIIPNPHNVRHHLGDIDSLAESIESAGILERLIVTQAPTDMVTATTGPGAYLLLAGHRRLAAAVKAGLGEVPVIVRPGMAALPDQIFAMLNENDHRAELNPVEQADAYQILLEYPDLDEATIAARVGRSKRHVQDRLKLGKAPAALREKVTVGQVTLADALTVQSYAKHPDLQVRLEQAAGTDKWGFTLEEAERAKKRRTECAKITRSYKARGIAVFDDQSERDKYRLDKARELNTDLLWSHAGTELPDDAETCGGMVAGEFEPYTTRLRWLRLVPEDADTTDDDDTTPAAAAAARPGGAEKESDPAAAAKLREDLAVAATLRRRFLADTLSPAAAPDIAHQIAIASLTEQLDGCDEEDFALAAELIGITLPEPGEDHLKNCERLVLEDARSMSVDEITVFAHILYRARADKALEDPAAWAPRLSDWMYGGASGWRTELAEWFGYEWTDTEAELIDRINDADATAEA